MPSNRLPADDAAFHTTRWTWVEAAGADDAERARVALAELCATYWYPLYVFVRRSGVEAHAAEDVVQGFFARLLEKRDLARVTRGHGRFRGFLRVAVRNHLANVRDRERAAKRGGGRVRLAVDLTAAEERFALEPAASDDPETGFDRVWARELLAAALERLGAEYRASGRGALFDALAPTLQGDELDTAVAARELGLTAGALRVAVHRLRGRFAAELRAAIAATVSGEEEVEAELDDLLRTLGG